MFGGGPQDQDVAAGTLALSSTANAVVVLPQNFGPGPHRRQTMGKELLQVCGVRLPPIFWLRRGLPHPFTSTGQDMLKSTLQDGIYFGEQTIRSAPLTVD